MKKVLVVDDWPGWEGPVPILNFDAEEATVKVVSNVDEAGGFFNGETGADVLVVGGIQGGSEFIGDVRKRFPKLHIIGLAEHLGILGDAGCNCFVRRDGLHSSISAHLERSWRQ